MCVCVCIGVGFMGGGCREKLRIASLFFFPYASVSACKPGRQGFVHKGIENGEESNLIK